MMPDGYQPHTAHGARIRADVIDVYVFTRIPPSDPRERARTSPHIDEHDAWPKSRASDASTVHFLQLLRAGEPLAGSWHPVMGHVHAGETSVQCALREMHEELGLVPTDGAFMGLWALEQVHPFYIAAIDTVVMSPRFACEVPPSFKPRLNDEHSDHRWVRETDIASHFMWPGQKACCREILKEIVHEPSLSETRLRVDLTSSRAGDRP